MPPEYRSSVDAFLALAARPDGRRGGLGICGALALLWVVLRLARRPGDVVVCMEYPSELRGVFRVQVARRKAALRRTPRRERASKHGRASSRTEHHMVAHETVFRGVAPGRWWVAVEGLLQDPDSDAVVKEMFETRSCHLKSRHTARVEFNYRPRGCMATVKVLWDGRPAEDASVAVPGMPNSLRYTKAGIARVELPLGSHRVIVGCGDRVAEREVAIASFQSTSLTIDLAQDVLFKGCPPAVTPYLQGDLGVAARALAREGQVELSHRLEARMHEQNGQHDRAAQLYQRAGDSESAIRLLLEIPRDDPGYADACEVLANAFEADEQFELAAQKLQEAIENAPEDAELPELYSRWATLLERCEDLPRALEVLRQLLDQAPDYPSVATRIEALEKRMSRDDELETTQLAGQAVGACESRYEVLEQIGAGGMGVVYRALDRRLHREVALKKLPENLRDHPAAVQLFLREAQAAAALNHPNIVTLFDADEEDGTFFITMELLEGLPLSALLRRQGRLGAGSTALGRQIAIGLHYAHESRIVHRDIKPANLFYTNEEVVKIMDFGLAKMIEEVRRSTTVLGGTPYYMAPEQSSGGVISTATDIYSFGVTMFELATGRVPFKEGDVAYEHRHTAPPDPRELVPQLPEQLAELILSMLAKQPESRPDAATIRDNLT